MRKQGGWERKESLQRSLQNYIFHFHPAKTPGTTQSVKTVTANVPQIRKSNNCLSSLDSQGRIEIIDLLACFRNSFPLHQRRMFFTTDWFFFYPLEVELQHAHSNNNSIDSCFVYIWKVVHIQKTKLPMVITNQACLTFYSSYSCEEGWFLWWWWWLIWHQSSSSWKLLVSNYSWTSTYVQLPTMATSLQWVHTQ